MIFVISPGELPRNVNAATIVRLAVVPNIAGIKEAGGDMAQCAMILRDCPSDFLIVSGDDALAFPQIAMGMQGVISVAANSFPQVFSDMVRAALDGDLKNAKKLNDGLIGDTICFLLKTIRPASRPRWQKWD
jgi:4-hydroxy-tetrahydrodipicolinate synthase